jgi:hypothetical protein
MVGMTTEKFLDALAVDAKLFFQREEHADQRECQLAFGIGHRHSATQLRGLSKELHGEGRSRYATNDGGDSTTQSI